MQLKRKNAFISLLSARRQGGNDTRIVRGGCANLPCHKGAEPAPRLERRVRQSALQPLHEQRSQEGIASANSIGE
eukprot:CAMPEP_0183347684 /NCGR_PEP_ID=MMETSP0164_2-20130417/12433_1 /TAXON_ID=221442 /ORGANISM="Coccolithus pelagicus ssp braarudi, Strain PLY182g" /LENGTH=74 /DNA_ID=CAMNT_0025519155 /DNA_START=306 /DNA_END=527 /DNA_ORIENTATION=-